MGDYTHMSVLDVEDAAEKFGMTDTHESRFGAGAFETEQTGFSLHRFKPGKRQPFGHRHDAAEDDGLEILAFGQRHAEDRGEVVQGWWSD